MSPAQRIRRQYVTRDVNQLQDEAASFGDRLSDGLARFAGSWTFITLFGGLLVLWVGLNGLHLLVGPFDPYPYIMLNLALSCLAVVQATVILMSQNRQAARDRLSAEEEFQRQMKVDAEVDQLHEKLDRPGGQPYLELIELQQQQIGLLRQLLEQAGIEPAQGEDGGRSEAHRAVRVTRRPRATS